jgi:hypothetical protein
MEILIVFLFGFSAAFLSLLFSPAGIIKDYRQRVKQRLHHTGKWSVYDIIHKTCSRTD